MSSTLNDSLRLAPMPYVTIAAAAVASGLSEKAIRRKIEEGVWLDGREYVKAPDGHIMISVKGYTLWVERGWVSKSANDPSVSRSLSRESRSAAP